MSIKSLNEEYSDAVLAERLPVEMKVEITTHAGTIQTLEGEVTFLAGDAIVTGVNNERWPVQRQRFDATYMPSSGTQIGQSGRYCRKPQQVYARKMAKAFEITLSDDRGGLQGKPGDWLVEYAPGDRSVISDEIFLKTYRIVMDNKNTPNAS